MYEEWSMAASATLPRRRSRKLALRGTTFVTWDRITVLSRDLVADAEFKGLSTDQGRSMGEGMDTQIRTELPAFVGPSDVRRLRDRQLLWAA
jgi:hypothetical protein